VPDGEALVDPARPVETVPAVGLELPLGEDGTDATREVMALLRTHLSFSLDEGVVDEVVLTVAELVFNGVLCALNTVLSTDEWSCWDRGGGGDNVAAVAICPLLTRFTSSTILTGEIGNSAYPYIPNCGPYTLILHLINARLSYKCTKPEYPHPFN